MVTATLEKLRERAASLKERQAALTGEWYAVNPSPPAGAKRRDEIRAELEEVSASLTRLSPEIAQAKSQKKSDRLAELLHSTEYKAAVTGALEDLATSLEPWLPVLTMTDAARRQAVTLPLPPGTISALWLEGREFVRTLVRRRVITDRDVPAPLRGLIAEVGQ